MTCIDTKKLREDAEALDKSFANLKKLFDDLFEMLLDINKKGKVWTGSVANKYVNGLSYDKIEFMNYLSDLKEYSNFMTSAADEYDNDVWRIKQ